MAGKLEHAQRADQGDWHCGSCDQGQAAVAKAQQEHQEHEQHRIAQAAEGALDAAAHKVGLINNQLLIHPGRKLGCKLIEGCIHRFANGDGVAAVALVDQHGYRWSALQVGGDRVVALAAQAHSAHIPQQGDAAIGAAGHHQLLQFRRTAQAPLHAQRQGELLAAGAGGFTHLAQGSQHVLLLQGRAHIGNGEAALLELGRVEPEPEGQAVTSCKGDVAHPRHPLQLLFHHLIEPAAQKGFAIELGIGTKAENHQQVVGAAPHLHPEARHRCWQLASHHRHFVLGVDLVELGVAALESQADGAAVGRAGGADAVEPLEAVELLLQQGGDPLLHHLWAGTWVGGSHRDSAGSNRRQVFHLQQR